MKDKDKEKDKDREKDKDKDNAANFNSGELNNLTTPAATAVSAGTEQNSSQSGGSIAVGKIDIATTDVIS